MKRIGIECHNLEKEKFGVGQTLFQLLKSIAEDENAKEKFRFVLYFNKKIPQDPILDNPIFEKKLLKAPILPPSFTFFYNILLPLAYIKDRLDGIFLPAYMMPAFFVGSPPHLFIYNAFRYFLKKFSFGYISLSPIKSRCGGKSIVVLTNDVYYESHFGNLPFKYKIAYRIFSWLAAKRANKIMTISEFSRKELARLYKIDINKINVITWGLNENMRRLEKTPENIQKLEAIKTKLKIKNKFILSVGQAFPRRKTKEAMLAFEKISGKFPDIQYVVASIDKYNPPILDELANQINDRLGREAILRVQYLSQDDILHLFNSTELLIYISSQEAMGLPPIEALKCGSVPLVADNELTHEMFGENAFFVKDIDSPNEIAQAIDEALSDKAKRDQVVKEGEAYTRRLSWRDFTDKLLKLFEETF